MKALHKNPKLKGFTEQPKKRAPKELDHVLVEKPFGSTLLTGDFHSLQSNVFADLIETKRKKLQQNNDLKRLFFSVGLSLSLLITIAVFEWNTSDDTASLDLTGSGSNFEDLLEIPQTQQIQKPPVVIVSPSIVEVADEEVIEKMEINLDIEMTAETRIEEIVFESQEEKLPEEHADEIFHIVEEQPQPNGGMKAFYDYVGQNLKYPTRASRMGIEGRVFVEFIVEKDGSLTDIKVARGIGGGCDEEAVRVIESSPKWNPGKQRGRPVRVRMVIPIYFQLV